MITQAQFDERVTKLYYSQKNMCAAKYWKSGKRAGMIRVEERPLLFTKQELSHQLWKLVGLGAIQCPYCKGPIDILSLTLDHIVPRSAGGEMSLGNLDAICKECNACKGDLSHGAFQAIIDLMQTFSKYDQGKLRSRLKAAHHGSAARFFRSGKRTPEQTEAVERNNSEVPAQPRFWGKLAKPHDDGWF